MGYVIRLNLAPAFSKEATRRRKQRMASVMLRQTQERIEAGGDEEYTFPALDFPRPDGTTTRPLWDSGTHLLNSLTCGVDDTGFWVGSNFIGAAIQQLGTRGKGGIKPTIRPVVAKALFIPMSKKGAKSTLQFGWGERRRVALVRRKGKRVAETLRQDGKKPDFMFTNHADIRPRKFLRLSTMNRRELIQTYLGF